MKYQAIEVIGEGSFGTVFSAHDENNIKVAVKKCQNE